MANSPRSSLRTQANQEVKIDKMFKVWTKPEYNTAINKALFKINSLGDGKWETQDKTTEGLTTALQQFYDEPVDFRGLKLAEFDDNELKRTEYEDIQRAYTTLPTGTPTHYYFYKNKIGLHPIPTTAKNLKLLYSTKVTDLTDDADLSPFAPQFDTAIALYVAYFLLSQPGDNRNLQRAQTKLARFNEEMSDLLKMFLYKDRENMRTRSTYIPKSAFRNSRRGRFAYL